MLESWHQLRAASVTVNSWTTRPPGKHSDKIWVKAKVTLTDIIVAFSLAKLLSQSKWSEALKLLRELLGGVRSKRVAALPAHLVVRLGFAGFVVLALHHVEHVSLSIQQWHLTLWVMWADDVQVVVELHLHGVVVPQKPAGGRRQRRTVTQVAEDW